jgi:hypothetical protein
MVLPYLLFWLNGQVFNWSNAPLLIMSWALHAWLGFILVRSFLDASRSEPRAARISVSAIMVTLLFYGAQFENFIWAMQLSFFLTFTLAAIAFGAHSRRRYVVTLLAATGSSLSMVNGLLVWPALSAQALILRRGVRAFLWPLVVAVAFGMAYSKNWGYMGGEPLHPITLLQQFLECIGGPANNLSGYFALFCGLTLVAVLGVCAYREFVSQGKPETRVPLSVLGAMTAFALGTTVLMVLGRKQAPTNFGDSLALPSRYLTDILILWACVSALAWLGRVRAFLALSVILVVSSAPTVFPSMLWWRSYFANDTRAIADALCHQREHPSMLSLHPDKPTLIRVTKELKERHQAFGADPWCQE